MGKLARDHTRAVACAIVVKTVEEKMMPCNRTEIEMLTHQIPEGEL